MNSNPEPLQPEVGLPRPKRNFITSIGFTGTRHGMTQAQRRQVEEKLLAWRPLEVHHGDELGADAEFHQMVRELLPETKIIVHPPKNPTLRAFCVGDGENPEQEYLTRNKNIVRASDLLLAVPHEINDELRPGTWSIIRYARMFPIWFAVFLPDGRPWP